MKPCSWITACCLNLMLFPALADEVSDTPAYQPPARPAAMPWEQSPCAEWHRAQHHPDYGYRPPRAYWGQGYPPARGHGQGYANQYPPGMNTSPYQGEAPIYPSEGGYGYGYAGPGDYPAPHDTTGSRYYEYPGYQAQGYDTQGMAPGYRPPPAYGYDNPPVPGYGYANPPAWGGESQTYYHDYRAAPPAGDYPTAYPAPRAYSAPYGEPPQYPLPHELDLDPRGFGTDSMMAPGYSAPPPAAYSEPLPIPGEPEVPTAAVTNPAINQIPSPQASEPPPAAMQPGGTQPAAEEAPAPTAPPIGEPETPATEQIPPTPPRAEAEGEPQEG